MQFSFYEIISHMNVLQKNFNLNINLNLNFNINLNMPFANTTELVDTVRHYLCSEHHFLLSSEIIYEIEKRSEKTLQNFINLHLIWPGIHNPKTWI